MAHRLGGWLAGLSVALAVPALAIAPTAWPAARGCGPRGYAYAGVESRLGGDGISATLAAVAQPTVERGHVAAWVGVGAPDEGPEAAGEWIQVGLNSEPGTASKLYYEVTRGGQDPVYVELDSDVAPGATHRVAVLEAAGRPNSWRVWIDGKPASRSIFLPASHRRLTPMAIAESWDGGAPACNRYAYRFGRVSLAAAPGGSWQRLVDADVRQDPGYRVVRSTDAGFLALTNAPVAGAPS
jgi:hypothetical protein